MGYTYSNLEEYVNSLYRSIDIYHPHQLDPETIASRLGLSIVSMPTSPMRIARVIALDNRQTNEQQHQAFAHELCHVLWHAGNQITMPMTWEVYQEGKANNFAQHVCIPTFMLQRLALPDDERQATWILKEQFGVEPEFAMKRLRQYIRKLKFG